MTAKTEKMIVNILFFIGGVFTGGYILFLSIINFIHFNLTSCIIFSAVLFTISILLKKIHFLCYLSIGFLVGAVLVYWYFIQVLSHSLIF